VNILFAWELGGNLGHLYRQMRIARELRGRSLSSGLHLRLCFEVDHVRCQCRSKNVPLKRTGFRDSARALAELYQAHTQAQVLQQIVDRIERLPVSDALAPT
jgi:hypothetical protein